MFIPPGGYGFQFSRFQQQQQQYNGSNHPAVSSAAGTQRLFSAPISTSRTVRTTGGIPLAPSPMPPPPPFSPAIGGYSTTTVRAAPKAVVASSTAQAATPSVGTPDILTNYPMPVTTPSSATAPQLSYSPVRTLYSNTPTPPAAIQVQVEAKQPSVKDTGKAVGDIRKDVDKAQEMSNEANGQMAESKYERLTKRTAPPRPSDARRPSESRKSSAKASTRSTVKAATPSAAEAATPSTVKAATPSAANAAMPSTNKKPIKPRGRQVNKRRSSPLIELSPPKKENNKPTEKPTAAAAAQQSSTSDVQLDKLRNVRRTAQLRNVPVGKAMRHFRDHCKNDEIPFTRESFGVAYRHLVESCEMTQSESDEDIAGVFDLFDRDKSGRLDRMEVVCGVCLICSGTEKEKLQSVFDMFDDDGDGQINLDEMTTFLCNVYRIVLTKTVIERMKAIGVTLTSPERLASVTAKECFASIDTNNDGMITCDEFHDWFCAPQRGQALFVAGTLDGVFT